MSRRLQVALYVAFTLFALAGSLVLTFPYGALRRRIEVEAGKAMPGSTLVINDIGPALPLGLRFADVVFARDLGDKQLKVKIDRIRLRPALWSLFTGKPGLLYTVDAFAGSVDGEVVRTKTGGKVEAVIKGLQLDEGKTLERATGLDLTGGLSGRVELQTDSRGLVTDGNIAAIVAGGKVKSGNIMGFSLPRLDLGSPEVNLIITKGQAKIAKAETKSPDLDFKATGDVSLAQNLMASLIKGNVHLRLTDAFLARNPTIKGMLGFAGPFRKPDGSIELPLNGPLMRPLSIPGFGGY